MKINTLAAAVILSLSTAGFALADDTAAPSAGKGRFPGWHNYMEHVISQLPADKAKLYRDSMQKAHEQNQASYDQEDKLQDELRDILTADKFDQKAYVEKSKELQAVRDKIAASMSESFASTAAQFTPDERKILAKLRRRPMRHHEDNGGAKPDAAAK